MSTPSRLDDVKSAPFPSALERVIALCTRSTRDSGCPNSMDTYHIFRIFTSEVKHARSHRRLPALIYPSTPERSIAAVHDTSPNILQAPLLKLFLIALDLITDSEVFPAVKRDTTLSILAHLLDIFLLIFD